jgi:PPOX class probable FMN-dependent enzyme
MAQITTLEQLGKLYGEPVGAAVVKEIDYISDDYRVFIDKSPFMILATAGPEGLDCSPRGDPAGFVRVLDRKTILIPDRRGNNRVDALRNIVRDPRVALLFLIPGIGNTLRVNGRAEILDDTELLESFAIRGKLPRTILRVTAESVYFQCPKALVRSRLWSPEAHVPVSDMPSAGQILAGLTKGAFDGAEYDKAYPKRIEETIY